MLQFLLKQEQVSSKVEGFPGKIDSILMESCLHLAALKGLLCRAKSFAPFLSVRGCLTVTCICHCGKRICLSEKWNKENESLRLPGTASTPRTSRAWLTRQMATEIRQGFENWGLHYVLAKAGVAEVGLKQDTKGVKDAEILINANGQLELELD